MFSLAIFEKNIGNYLFLVFIVINVACCIIFGINGLDKIKEALYISLFEISNPPQSSTERSLRANTSEQVNVKTIIFSNNKTNTYDGINDNPQKIDKRLNIHYHN